MSYAGITLGEDADLAHWQNALGVSREVLVEAVTAVGRDPESVREYLKHRPLPKTVAVKEVKARVFEPKRPDPRFVPPKALDQPTVDPRFVEPTNFDPPVAASLGDVQTAFANLAESALDRLGVESVTDKEAEILAYDELTPGEKASLDDEDDRP